MYGQHDRGKKTYSTGYTGLSLGFIFILAAALILLPSHSDAKKEKKPETAPAAQIVWPGPPDKPRVKYIESFSGEGDFKKKDSTFVRTLLGKKDNKGQIALLKPLDVAVNSDGVIFVSDTGQGVVIAIDSKNAEVKPIGMTGPGQLTLPTGLTVDRHNNLYVCDAYLKKVFVFGPDYNLKFTYGELGDLERPADVALDEDRNLVYVTDSKLHVIKVFQIDQASFVREIGKRGVGDGEFNFPSFITTNSLGDIFVIDSMNFRIQVIDRNGNFKFKFGQAGSAHGTFTRPKGVALDTHGNVYVADAAFGNFQIFDTEGRVLLAVGRFGGDASPGVFNLAAGIWVDKENKIYVVDQLNHRVQIFQLIDASMDDVEDDAQPQPPQPQ